MQGFFVFGLRFSDLHGKFDGLRMLGTHLRDAVRPEPS